MVLYIETHFTIILYRIRKKVVQPKYEVLNKTNVSSSALGGMGEGGGGKAKAFQDIQGPFIDYVRNLMDN